MSINIIEVKGKALLKEFIKWPLQLYKGCDNWVPPLEGDEFDTLDPSRNAAFEYCEAQCFLAKKDGETVGRVAAIMNKKANEIWKENVVRFGWLDFIEDAEVLKALLDAVEKWGKERDCVSMKGPWGFTDMDKEGSIVEGYENLSPFTCLYNYPYYDRLLQEYGLKKDVDWTQRVLYVEKDNTPVSYAFADKISSRFGLKVAQAPNMRQLCKRYGMKIFHLYNESFAPLFEFTPLSDKQIKRYLQTYVPILSRKFVPVVVDENDNPVGFCFCVPSLSKAVKKSGGKLFPFGFIRILHALRHNDTLEALLMGVLPEYQGKGATVLMLRRIHQSCLSSGIKQIIMNPQLEENYKVQSLFGEYRQDFYMKRRAYSKKI